MRSPVRAEAVRPLLVIGLALTGPDSSTLSLLPLTLSMITIYIRHTESKVPRFRGALRSRRRCDSADP
jgi:hypothetical protein